MINLQLLKNPQIRIFCSFICLIIFHQIITWNITANIDLITTNLVFYGVIIWLLYKKRTEITLKNHKITQFLGIVLISAIFAKSFFIFLPTDTQFWRVAALISTLGFILIISSWQGLKQFWIEYLILCLMLFPSSILEKFIENEIKLTILTAKFSAFWLHYIGFEVQRHLNTISLPNGSVFVGYSCTGTPMIVLILKLSLLFSIMFPLPWKQKLWVVIAGLGMCFLLGGIRVALLAVIVSDKPTFDYWHGTQGAQIFSTLSMVGFAWLCKYMLDSFNNKDSSSPSDQSSIN
ncbi:MAG TPA: cyanoexosortase A [Allocoleopsis sp.]